MDNPGDAKYGMTTEQLFEAFKVLKSKGAKEFGIHAFLASNTVTNDYYPMLAKVLFEQAVKLQKETGVHIKFINLSGGIGIPYTPDQEPNDIRVIVLIDASSDKLLHKKQMAFIDFLGNLPTYDGQMKEPIIIHGQKTSIFQNAYRMADTRFAKAHVPGKVNGADHAHFLL